MAETSDRTEVERLVRRGFEVLVAEGPDPAKRWRAIDERITEHQSVVSGRRRLVAGAAATVAACVGGAWFVKRDADRSTQQVTVGTAPPESAAHARVDWQHIVPAPLPARHSPYSVWGGEDLILWGGAGISDPDYRVGASWHRASGTWKTIASAPAGSVGEGFAVWGGTEMFVGPTEIDASAPWNEGVSESDARYGIAAYDPGSDRWRYVAPVPSDGVQSTLTSARQAVFALDGSLLVAARVARPAGGPPGAELVRVDVSSGDLQVLEAGPFAASRYSDASGTVALAVVGGFVVATTNWDLRPWVLNLQTGTWIQAEAPPAAESLHLLPATPIGREAIFIESDGPSRFWSFNPSRDGSGAWRAIAPNPYQPARWRYEPVWSGSEYFVPGAAYDPAQGSWREVEPPPRGPDRQRTLHAMWATDALLLFGGEEYDCPDRASCERNPGSDSLDGWIRTNP